LFVVCLFLGVRDSRQNKKKEKGARQKKNGRNEWTGPPTISLTGLLLLFRHAKLIIMLMLKRSYLH
jgi:hypothetical protein